MICSPACVFALTVSFSHFCVGCLHLSLAPAMANGAERTYVPCVSAWQANPGFASRKLVLVEKNKLVHKIEELKRSALGVNTEQFYEYLQRQLARTRLHVNKLTVEKKLPKKKPRACPKTCPPPL